MSLRRREMRTVPVPLEPRAMMVPRAEGTSLRGGGKGGRRGSKSVRERVWEDGGGGPGVRGARSY
jgi:hypothetical protein